MKKWTKLCLILATMVFANFMFRENLAAADDFTITVADNSASKNQEFVFQYADIEPGFQSDAPINIVNQAGSVAEIKLLSIDPVNQAVAPKPDPANNLFPFVNLSLSRDGVTIAQGTAANPATLIDAEICVPAAETERLMTHFDFPTSVGNQAQNTSLWLKYVFQITVGGCDFVVPTENSDQSTVRPPTTGETSLPFLVLGGTSFAAFLAALIFANFFLIAALKKKKKEYEKRKIVRK